MKNQRLFMGSQPGGLIFADRHREERGDYKRVGLMPWDTLELRPARGADPTLVEEARAVVATFQGREGELQRISTCGQTVMLGRRCDDR